FFSSRRRHTRSKRDWSSDCALPISRLVHAHVTGEEGILPIYGHREDLDEFEKLSHDFTEGVAYDPEKALQIGPFTITFLKTVHSVPCYGMRITDGKTEVVFTADTAYQEEWIDFSRGADLLIVDCNFYEGQNASEAGHMTSEEGARIADKAAVKELMLSHLPQFGDPAKLVQEAEKYFQGKIFLAKEGITWAKQ